MELWRESSRASRTALIVPVGFGSRWDLRDDERGEVLKTWPGKDEARFMREEARFWTLWVAEASVFIFLFFERDSASWALPDVKVSESVSMMTCFASMRWNLGSKRALQCHFNSNV